MNLNIFYTNDIFSGLLILFIVVFFIFISEILFNFFNVKGFITRKFLHFSIGFLLILSPYFFNNNLVPIIISILFTIVNLILIKFNIFKSIHYTKNKNYGTLFYPIAYLILCLFWWEKTFVFQLSLCILTVSDSFASIIGNIFPNSKTFILWKDKKSINGTIAMAISSFFLVGFGLLISTDFIQQNPFSNLLFISFFVALISTLSESISINGSDNFSIPIFSAISIDLAHKIVLENSIFQTIMWICFLGISCYFFSRISLLKKNGSITAFLMGIILFSIAKWQFLIPISIFFLTSSLLSKISLYFFNKNKKESNRDLTQVLCNGITPLFFSILWFYTSKELFFFSFLASISAVNSDTWATEIGSLSKKKPFNSINYFKKINKGESGGITLFGIIGAILGSIITSFFSIKDIKILILVSISGFLACYFDSILGSTLQGKFKCKKCKKKNEIGFHCNETSELIHGFKIFTNNFVNFLCSSFSGLALIILLYFLNL